MDNFENFVHPDSMSPAQQNGIALKGSIAANLANLLFSLPSKLNSMLNQAISFNEELNQVKELLNTYIQEGEKAGVEFPQFNKIIMGLGSPGQFSQMIQFCLSNYADFHLYDEETSLVVVLLRLSQDKKLNIHLISEAEQNIESASTDGKSLIIQYKNGGSNIFGINEAIEKYPEKMTEGIIIPDKIVIVNSY